MVTVGALSWGCATGASSRFSVPSGLLVQEPMPIAWLMALFEMEGVVGHNKRGAVDHRQNQGLRQGGEHGELGHRGVAQASSPGRFMPPLLLSLSHSCPGLIVLQHPQVDGTQAVIVDRALAGDQQDPLQGWQLWLPS